MTTTFTVIPIRLRVNKTSLPEVIRELEYMYPQDNNNVFTIDTSFHVNSIESADIIVTGLDNLKAAGAIGQYECECALSQINGFKRLYLK